MRDNKRLEPKINLCRSRERKSDYRERERQRQRGLAALLLCDLPTQIPPCEQLRSLSVNDLTVTSVLRSTADPLSLYSSLSLPPSLSLSLSILMTFFTLLYLSSTLGISSDVDFEALDFWSADNVALIFFIFFDSPLPVLLFLRSDIVC